MDTIYIRMHINNLNISVRMHKTIVTPPIMLLCDFPRKSAEIGNRTTSHTSQLRSHLHRLMGFELNR